MKTRYITPDEFKLYSGIDLAKDLKDDSNPSNKGEAFLFRIETRIAAFINARFYKNVDSQYPHFTDYQKEHYKIALMEQAIYELRNGEIYTDSGHDPDEGEKMSPELREKIAIAPACKDQLILVGIWNRKIRNMGRGGYGWWNY